MPRTVLDSKDPYSVPTTQIITKLTKPKAQLIQTGKEVHEKMGLARQRQRLGKGYDSVGEGERTGARAGKIAERDAFASAIQSARLAKPYGKQRLAPEQPQSMPPMPCCRTQA